jgi:hypothetical protein
VEAIRMGIKSSSMGWMSQTPREPFPRRTGRN